jgi:ATP-dependent RNA helicase DeaD
VDDITHVFNYHLPDDIESYTHRSGRTARAGKKGIAISLVHPRDAYKIKQVEKQINKKLKLVKVPTGEVIVEKQIYHFIDSVHKTEVDETLIDDYLPKVFKELESFSKDEIIKKMVMAEVSKYLKAYENARDLNASPGKRDMEESPVKSKRRGDRDANKKRVFINIGRNDGIREKGGVLRFICDASGVGGKHIGRIDLLDNMSFVDIDAEFGNQVVALNGQEFEGKTLRVEFSQDKNDRNSRRQGRSQRPSGNGENRKRTRTKSNESYNERSFF